MQDSENMCNTLKLRLTFNGPKYIYNYMCITKQKCFYTKQYVQ